MKIIRIYQYDTNKLNLIKEKIFYECNIRAIGIEGLRKNYYQGFNIALRIQDEFESPILNMLKGFKNEITEFDKKINEKDMNKIASLIKTIVKMEENKVNCFPLRDNGEIVVNNFDEDLYPGEVILPLIIRKQIDKIQFHLATKYFKANKSYSEDDIDFLLAKMFVYFSSLGKGGIASGYLSLKSNAEYFKEQLKDVNDYTTREKLYKTVYILNEKLLCSIDNFNGNLLLSEEGMTKYFREYVNKVARTIFNANINDFNIKGMYFPDDFFDRHSHWSSFHEKNYRDSEMLKLYKTENFIKYRICMGVFYGLLPDLDLSNIRKERITVIATKLAETIMGEENG